MTNNKIIVPIALCVAVGIFKFYTTGSRNATLDLYPDVDPKVAKAAYKSLMRKSMRGELEGTDFDNLEEMEAIFRAEVAKITNKK